MFQLLILALLDSDISLSRSISISRSTLIKSQRIGLTL